MVHAQYDLLGIGVSSHKQKVYNITLVDMEFFGKSLKTMNRMTAEARFNYVLSNDGHLTIVQL